MVHTRKAAACVVGFAAHMLSGCGSGGGGGDPTPSPSPTPTPSPSPGPTPTPPGPSPTPGQLDPETSIWAWRRDMDHGIDISYDLSGDYEEHGFYGGCWRFGDAETLAECLTDPPAPPNGEEEFDGTTCKVDKVTYVEHIGDVGVKLYNHKRIPEKRGCLMRKTRVPIDLSKIDRLEVDLKTTGTDTMAPWYAVWLVPMNYSLRDDNAKAAEIDLIENYDYRRRGLDTMDSLQTAFAQCGVLDWTYDFCTAQHWTDTHATQVDHHITIQATEDPNDGRILSIYRCRNPAGGKPLPTCDEGSPAVIKVQKKPINPKTGQHISNWFPIWNKDAVGANYAHYWLMADAWLTSNTDFTLAVENLKMYMQDGEWTMPLDYGPDNDLGVYGSATHSRMTELSI